MNKRPYKDKDSLNKILQKIVAEEWSQSDNTIQDNISFILGMFNSTLKAYNVIDLHLFNHIFIPIARVKIWDNFVEPIINDKLYCNSVPLNIRMIMFAIYENILALALMMKYGWKFNACHEVFSKMNDNIYHYLNQIFDTDDTFILNFLSYGQLQEMKSVIDNMLTRHLDNLYDAITVLQTKPISNERKNEN